MACPVGLHAPGGDSGNGSPSWPKVVLFYLSLYIIAVAQGADKPCSLAFAADHPKEHASRGPLFNWWYFSMAASITVVVSVVSYIQENVGWGLGFSAPCAITLYAFLAFLIGIPTYRLYAPTPGAESPFTRLARRLVALARSSTFFSSQQQRQEDEDEEEEGAKSEEVKEQSTEHIA